MRPSGVMKTMSRKTPKPFQSVEQRGDATPFLISSTWGPSKNSYMSPENSYVYSLDAPGLASAPVSDDAHSRSGPVVLCQENLPNSL
jgi:hypothetical protein